MSIDIRNETTISLNQVARMLPPGRRGRPVHLSCVLRWIIDGVRTPKGPVRLEALRIGSRWITSIEAVQRFAGAQTPDLDCPKSIVQATDGARLKAADRAGKALVRLGM
jgi:hypothetical protein